MKEVTEGFVSVEFYKMRLKEVIDSKDVEIDRLRKTLTILAADTMREEYGCPGSHSQYSSMADDTICEHCRRPEDGPGGNLVRTVPTRTAKIAIEALK